MTFTFTRAAKFGSKLRMAIIGSSGSGKTYSALSLASGLGKKIAFIDTEHGSARKYADVFSFDVLEFDSFAVENFLAAIEAAEKANYDVLIIDSLSHAWSGKDGLLEFVDAETQRSKAKNAYTSGWRSATPLHNKLIDAILTSKMHILCCMRSKTEYVMQDDPRTGKKMPVKIGMQPVQREGMEYEFDVIGDMDVEHTMIIGKTRCSAIDGKLFPFPGAELAAILNEWLGGEPAPVVQRVTAPVAAPAPAPAPVNPTPSRSPETEIALDRLRRRIGKYHSENICGYGNIETLKRDIKAVFGVDDLKLLNDSHYDQIVSWYDGLGKYTVTTDTPFSSPADVVPAAPVADQPALDYSAIVQQIESELASRNIPEQIRESLAANALRLAEKESPVILTVLDSAKAYPVKSAEPNLKDSARIMNLQSEVSMRVQTLVMSNIDGFENSARLTKSLEKHLGTKTVKACKDMERLANYAIHLQEKIESQGKAS